VIFNCSAFGEFTRCLLSDGLWHKVAEEFVYWHMVAEELALSLCIVLSELLCTWLRRICSLLGVLERAVWSQVRSATLG